MSTAVSEDGNGVEEPASFCKLIRGKYDIKADSDVKLLCCSCPNFVPLCFVSMHYPSWCLSFACGNRSCNKRWSLCYRCTKPKRLHRMVDQKKHDVEMHGGVSELDSEELDSQELGSQELDSQELDSPVETELEEINADKQLMSKLKTIYPPGSNWAEFFVNNRNGKGKKFLVARQFADTVDPDSISDDDADLHMLIAALTHALGKNEKAMFAEILRRVRCKFLSETSDGQKFTPLGNTTMTDCSVPTKNLLLSHYVKGTRAIMTNLPVPNIHIAENGDAFVSLSDVLKLYFSFGLQPHGVKRIQEAGPLGSRGTVNNVWESREAKSRLQKLAEKSSQTIKFAMIKWSDGCDPNRSTKGARGSMHVGTVSLFAPGNTNDPRYTFVVHIGRDDSDHMEVGRAVLKEIEQLELPHLVYDGDSFKEAQLIHTATIENRSQ